MRELWLVYDSRFGLSQGLAAKGAGLAGEHGLVCRTLSVGGDSPADARRACAELLALYENSEPEVILFESSSFLADVAPAFAVSIGRGLTADCTDLRWDEAYGLLQIRPSFGGRRIAVNRSLSRPSLASVRRGVFGASFAADDAGAKTLDVAPLIFSGGLGLGSRAAFERLALLAGRCGAMLGASRAAVAAGYADYRFQIGQTGVSVQPKLYVAFGISGAVQHLSGILGAAQIIAVNTDPHAPIMDYADYALLADANTVIEELLARFDAGSVPPMP